LRSSIAIAAACLAGACAGSPGADDHASPRDHGRDVASATAAAARDACLAEEGALCNEAAAPVDSREVPRLRSNLATGTFAAWRDAILPTPEETAWEAIPWLPSFHEGVRVADERDAPLLVWVMNGHPLGCT